MAESDRKTDKRVKRARDLGGKAAEKGRAGIGWLVAIVVGVVMFVAGVLPDILGWALHAFGWATAAVGAAAVALGGWFRKHSDEKHERAAWGAVLVLGIGVLVFFLGGI